MSNLEKALKRYFESVHDNKTSASSLDFESSNEELNADIARSGANKNRLIDKNDPISGSASRQLKLDIPYLNELGILGTDACDQQLVEEYRNIKRLLLKNAFAQGVPLVKDGRLVLITSSIAGEGKTFTSINLALSIARELDRTVLLVDTDVSRQGISRMLGMENKKGLTDILSNRITNISEAAITFAEPKFNFIPAGHMYPNVAELLASENMRRLTQKLLRGNSNRVVLFDAPPLLVTSDARILAGLAGQILLVVEAENTSYAMVKEAISLLDSSKAIGLVLNKSHQKPSRAFSYGYYNSAATPLSNNR